MIWKVCPFFEIICIYIATSNEVNIIIIKKKTTSKETSARNFFGRKTSVLFDDGKRYVGIITGRDETRDVWVTKFENGTEDTTIVPSMDKDCKLID